jgi:rubredoxin
MYCSPTFVNKTNRNSPYLSNRIYGIIILLKLLEVRVMGKYECLLCGYVYDPSVGDPDAGISAGTSFDDLPDEWVCPVCGAGKDQFGKI